jgi:hypothetical protein
MTFRLTGVNTSSVLSSDVHVKYIPSKAIKRFTRASVIYTVLIYSPVIRSVFVNTLPRKTCVFNN